MIGWRLGATTAVVAVTAALLAAGCGGSSPSPPSGSVAPTARPSSTATLAFASPTPGQEVASGSAIPVEITLTGGRIVAQTSADLKPDEGHIHLYLDDELVSMNYGLTATLDDVPAGTHLLRAEFVAADHAPFDPRVFTQVAFEVKP
jgi:hypothetical protein